MWERWYFWLIRFFFLSRRLIITLEPSTPVTDRFIWVRLLWLEQPKSTLNTQYTQNFICMICFRMKRSLLVLMNWFCEQFFKKKCILITNWFVVSVLNSSTCECKSKRQKHTHLFCQLFWKLCILSLSLSLSCRWYNSQMCRFEMKIQVTNLRNGSM